MRIGFFAGIHGDEPAGTHALIKFLETLCGEPVLAEGYDLFFYPVCNPRAFAARTRLSPSGKDLNREFWRNSNEPEVRLLEQEIRTHAFQGLISLHSDDTSDGLYGFVRGAVLTRGLLEPALAAAEKVVARNRKPIIDGFPGRVVAVISNNADAGALGRARAAGIPTHHLSSRTHPDPDASTSRSP